MKRLIVVIGKTFSGKTTFVNSMKNYHQVKTHTTRPVRKTESGDEYYFEDKNIYENKKKKGLVLSPRDYDTVEGIWSYWFEEKDLIDGKNVIILDLQGAKELYNKKGDSLDMDFIYINTSINIIKARIKTSSRGKTESSAESTRRLNSDIKQHKVLDSLIANSQEKYDSEVDITWLIHSETI